MAISAANTVFQTVELVEMILLDCSMEDAARAREVNSFFKDIVDCSKSLRRKMFLDPALSSEKLCCREGKPGQPLVVQHGDNTYGDDIRTIVKVHPLLQVRRCHSIELADLAEIDERFFNRAPGMWENMLATQPPCAELKFTSNDEFGPMGVRKVSQAQTLGQIRDELAAYHRGCFLLPKRALGRFVITISGRGAPSEDHSQVAKGRTYAHWEKRLRGLRQIRERERQL
ncbi:unnamed protein product [Zymoseptoria tritici ST99CH_3D1]|nr:unnamed protein product [Zymoseptoria tritici ST99CH_3D1]